MRYLRLLFLLIFISPLQLFAAEYSWYARDGNGYWGTGVSPSAACSVIATKRNVNESQTNGGRTFSLVSVSKLTDTNFQCTIEYSWSTGSATYPVDAFRSGDSCPPDTTYNAATGTCEGDPEVARCQSLEGQQTQGTTTGNVNDPDATVGRSGNSYYNKQREFNMGGCKVDVGLGGSGGKCVFKADGTYACKFPVGYTGEVAESQSDMDELPEEPEPQKTADSEQDCSAWADAGNGTRSKSCTSTSTASEEGGSTCQRGDYNMTCYKPTPTPESDTNIREDEITETSNPDGGKTTTTDSTTTNTHCLDGSCNTSTTNTSTTVITDGSGNVTGESSTCSGSNCTDPGADGDGEGDGPGEEETFVSPGGGEFGNASDALPSIGEDGDKTYGEATQEYMDRIADSPIVSSITSISVPTGGSCSIGSASLFGGSVSFNHFCSMASDVLDGLRYIFLAIWAWAAIRLLFTA